MGKQLDYIELVRQAQRGNEENLDRLAELARQRLQVYMYRLTLQDDLAEDIVQETMLEMCRILGKLKKPDRFWPWLYGIAINKLHRHRRTERTEKNKVASAVRHAAHRAKHAATLKQREAGLENLVGQELKQIVAKAMQSLKTRHRAVLIMRCYDGMSYAEIAESMGCSEFSTRMLFLRAKRALQRQLSRNGLARGSLLTALLLFGKMTAPTEAAAAQVSVTAATTKVGFAAGVVGLITSKAAVVSVMTAGALTVGTVAVTSRDQSQILTVVRQVPNYLSPLSQTNNSDEEYWYFFPNGPDGPMMMRAKSGTSGPLPDWHVLQNDQANYHYRDNTIHINNYRMATSDLSVFRLPTDSHRLRQFLSQVEPDMGQMDYVPGQGKGLLVIAQHKKDEDNNRFWAVRHYNVLDEDYFQNDWPSGAKAIDNRDTMHKRGWTYFRIAGNIDAEMVSGAGRIPFVYATSRQYSPWLKLQVGDALRIVDSSSEACIYAAGGKLLAGYKGGSFFKGLMRPWMGLHTLDTVRRDAAEQAIWFETKHSAGSGKAEVELACGQVNLLYRIDLQADLIDEIVFLTGGQQRGRLTFCYLQDIARKPASREPSAGSEFAKPRIQSYRRPQQAGIGLLWLVRLAEGSLIGNMKSEISD